VIEEEMNEFSPSHPFARLISDKNSGVRFLLAFYIIFLSPHNLPPSNLLQQQPTTTTGPRYPNLSLQVNLNNGVHFSVFD